MKKLLVFLLSFFILTNVYAFESYYDNVEGRKKSDYFDSNKTWVMECAYNSEGVSNPWGHNYILEYYSDGSYDFTEIDGDGENENWVMKNWIWDFTVNKRSVKNWEKENNATITAKSVVDSGVCPQLLVDDHSGMGISTYLVNSKGDLTDKIKIYGDSDYKTLVYSRYEDDKAHQEIGKVSLDGHSIHCDYGSYSIYFDSNGEYTSLYQNSKGLLAQSTFFYYAADSLHGFKMPNKDVCPTTYECSSTVNTSSGSSMRYTIYLDKIDFDNTCNKKNEMQSTTPSEDTTLKKSSCYLVSNILGYEGQKGTLEESLAKYKDTQEGIYSQKANNLVKEVRSYCKNVYINSKINTDCMDLCLKSDKVISSLKNTYGVASDRDGNANCSLSSRLINWVFKIINWLRYIVPVLLIILSILDFIKAIASDSEDEVKKVTGKFTKRLIVAVIIFILPLALDFLLGIFGIDTNNFCL